MFKTFMLLGCINAFLAVASGAFGAHGLKTKISEKMLAVYETGVHYHMIHSLALILVALAADKLNHSPLVSWSGWLLFSGIVLFSGSLYALSTSGMKMLGIITPFGGVAFLAGWILLAVAAIKS